MNSSILQAARHRPASRILYLFPFALMFVIACGESTTGEPTTRGSNPIADAYLSHLPPWDEFSPPDPDDKGTKTGDPEDLEPETVTTEIPDDPDTPDEDETGESEATYNCTSTPYSMTATPEKIVTLNPDVEVLWVGSLLQGSGYVGGLGSLEELPIRQRAPISIQIDLLTGNNTRTVDDPTPASVNQAIGELVEAATNSGLRAGSKISFAQQESNSVKEGMLRLGFSASYSGVGITSKLEVNRKASESTVMATYTQQMFTASMVLPQTPGAVFSDAFTEEVLQEQVDLNRMGPDNLPVFVSSVVYGRTIVFSMTAAGTAEEIEGALKIASGGGLAGVELSGAQKNLLKTSDVRIVSIGGDAANAAAVIQSGDFSSYFDKDADLTTAKPLSYTIRNLADNVLAKVSDTKSYKIQTCTQQLPDPTGGRYKLEFTRATVIALPNIDGTTNSAAALAIEMEIKISVNDRQIYRYDYDDPGTRPPAPMEYRKTESFFFPVGQREVMTEQDIHYDGRGAIHVLVHVLDYDTATNSDLLTGTRRFEYPGSPIPDSGVAYVEVKDTTKNHVRVWFNITKVDDLFD